MFTVNSSKRIFHANNVTIYSDNICGTYPYIVRATTKNGQRGYIKADKKEINSGNTLTFAQDTFTVFYQKNDFTTGNKVKVLKPKFDKFDGAIATFVLSSINHAIKNLTWGTGSDVKMIESIKFQLPIKNGEIDFLFMKSLISELEEERISELEEERISELTAYLKVSGLDNYELTAEEQKAINDYKDLRFSNFDITKIFDVKNTKNILSRDIIDNGGKTPYLCASSENNAVSSYIIYNESLKDKGNCIFIGGKTFVVSYQENDFYSNDSHNLALYLKEYKTSKNNQLYLATCVDKSLSHQYSWGNSVSKQKIKTDVISLPTKDNKTYFGDMDVFISAIKKLVIKDVVIYANKKIEATKEVVNSK